ncbi:MAG: hypothetical protein GX366_06450 [Epulopiscium sp.]|nr:hypothetical protein [Candidatus Epulonipiscium sp.]
MDKQKVIKIKGSDSGWYQEAIFILKKDVINNYSYMDLQRKADMIIGNHAKKNGLDNKTNKKDEAGSLDRTLNFILAISICILLICLYIL